MITSTQSIFSVKDWNEALKADWQINGETGKWAIEAGRLTLEANQGGSAAGIELVTTTPMQFGSSFSVEIELEFLSMGLADNTTENDANFVLEVGSGDGQPGFQVFLVGDRYKLDVDRSYLQYLIFRSQPKVKYLWRFEVRNNQLALIRDGVYYGLHQLQGSRQAGIRLRVCGTQDVPAQVEVGAICIQPLPEQAEPVKRVTPLNDSVEPGEWPMFRRDRKNTAQSPLVGNWQETPPQVLWSYPLGGWDSNSLTCDIDGDGKEELLISYDGKMSAFRFDGSLFWSRNIDSPRIFEIVDLDEDGRQEIVMSAGTPARVEVLDAVTGQTRYVGDFDPESPVRGLRIGKLDPSRKGLQIVVWSSSEIGCCLAFDQGLEHGQVVWTFNYVYFNFTPEVVLADMDRDGLLEVVLATYSTFFVYDGCTGKEKMKLEAPLGRNYGLLVVQDIDGDGYPDIVMLAESLREHITVVKNEGGKSLRLLYDKFYEQNYPLDLRELRTLPGSVRDWDGDGQVEILYGLFDETDGNNWRTLLIDAVSGAVKTTLENLYPLSLDVLPDGTPLAFLGDVQGRGRQQLVLHGDMSHMSLQVEGCIHLVQFLPHGTKQWGDLPSNQPLIDYSWQSFPLNEWAIFMQKRQPLRLGSEQGLYLVENQPGKEKESLCRYHLSASHTLEMDWECAIPDQLPAGQIVGICRQPGKPAGEPPVVLFGANDTHLYLIGPGGAILQSFAGGSITGVPVVARLEKGKLPSVLVCSAGGSLLCLEAASNQPEPSLKWSAPALWKGHTLYGLQGQAIPVAFDWNQDGDKEILLGQPKRSISVLDPHGTAIWGVELPEEPTFWNYGNFTGGDRFDIFAAFSNGAYGGGWGVYSKNLDQPVWQSDNGAYTTAISDMDGDGKDDILTRDLFWRRTLDGLSGRDIFPITQWAGYHTPTLVPSPEKNGGVSVVWSAGNYSLVAEKQDGAQVWWRPFMSTWRPGAVADVDGDGRLEIGAPTWGKVFTWPPPMDPLPGLGTCLACLDLATGEPKWTYDPGASISGVVSADVDGDGLPEFIFGTGDGRLMALRGGSDEARRVVFCVQLPAALGTPIICDPTGSSNAHILVGCADGNLYALK